VKQTKRRRKLGGRLKGIIKAIQGKFFLFLSQSSQTVKENVKDP
jgi:hypothetical protein